MEYNINEFRNWLENNVTLSTAFSTRSLRILVAHILKGNNYRLITERNTKDKLILHYLWLYDIYANAVREYGDNWKERLINDLQSIKRKTPEQKNLLTWLIGMPQKTAKNLDIDNVTTAWPEISGSVTELLDAVGRREDADRVWLMLMGGAATLTIRGSDKSRVGKQVERILIKSALTILGFTFNQNFWINIDRDAEVGRETDAEVQTRRGRTRIEVGLIAPGNQEVIEDKIGRVGRNGIILFDKIGANSRIATTATATGVHLIQIRGGNPLEELHTVLSPLVEITLNPVPDFDDIDRIVAELPEDIFTVDGVETSFEETE